MDHERYGNAKGDSRERGYSSIYSDASSHTGSTVDDAIISSLERDGDYKVLRRLPPPPPIAIEDDSTALIALDLETTGLDHLTDEIIEVALVRVRYDLEAGRMLGIEGTFTALRDPSIPLAEAISRMTGLWPEDLAGRWINPDDVAMFVRDARLIIAHNAGFDRRFAEAAWPVFSGMAWADSYTQADLAGHGYEGGRLGHLVLQSGFFYDAHRAIDDVFAMLHILGRETSAGTPFRSLLENARRPACRVWADGAPFVSRHLLKARSYRWSDGTHGAPRAWYRDVPLDEARDEVAFLREAVLMDAAARPRIVPISAYDRFTDRAGLPALVTE